MSNVNFDVHLKYLHKLITKISTSTFEVKFSEEAKNGEFIGFDNASLHKTFEWQIKSGRMRYETNSAQIYSFSLSRWKLSKHVRQVVKSLQIKPLFILCEFNIPGVIGFLCISAAV